MTSHTEFQLAATAYMNEDFAQAFPLMTKCAKAGNPVAQFLLALMYKDGQGTETSDESYRFWLRRFVDSAENGNAVAQWELSCHFRWGNHFPLDIERANYWLEKAAENGNADAQYHLAHYLAHGEFTYDKDSEGAHRWLMKAVEKDHPEALYVYSLEFFEGGDKTKPTPRAIELLKKAADRDFTPAKELLAQLIH